MRAFQDLNDGVISETKVADDGSFNLNSLHKGQIFILRLTSIDGSLERSFPEHLQI